jgi:hypothetical protein
VSAPPNPSIRFREKAVGGLTAAIGVYVLCDLDNVPIYVGQATSVSERGIRGRVQRHLTSARSDVIANRLIDVWEVAFVRAWPSASDAIDDIEAALFVEMNRSSPLMQKAITRAPPAGMVVPPPQAIAQVMPDDEIAQRRTPSLRLPRQAEHYSQMVSHYLTVKDSREIADALRAHFDRLSKYHRQLLQTAQPEPS